MFSGTIRTTFHAIICKSNRYMNSFFPVAIASWTLFMEILHYIEVPSIDIIKKRYSISNTPRVKQCFQISWSCRTPLSISIESKLKSLKMVSQLHWYPFWFRHCKQGIEDTSHFLFSCPSYVRSLLFYFLFIMSYCCKFQGWPWLWLNSSATPNP